MLESVSPAVKIVEGPLQRFDQLLCGGLDAVEQRVPSMYLPPKMVCYVFLVFFLALAVYDFLNSARISKYLFTDLQQYQGIHV